MQETPLDDRAIQDLADFSRFMRDEWGVPLTTSVPWPKYPTAPVKLGAAAFTAYRGQLGHMHAPYNDHSDPGNLNVARILQLASGTTPPPPPQEDDDMGATSEQILAIMRGDGISGSADPRYNGAERIEAAVKENSRLLAEVVRLLSEGDQAPTVAEVEPWPSYVENVEADCPPANPA